MYLFINQLLRHLSHIWAREYAKFPTVLHCTTAQKYGRKAEKQKGCTKPTEIVVAVVFFLFVFQATSDALGTKTFRGLLHDIRMSFVQERVHTGCHTITSVQFIRNESLIISRKMSASNKL